VPIIADEGFTGVEDMAHIARCYHGINLKLMKTGGMIPALHHLWKARQYGMKVMVGCMLESSIANTAAAIVALWADFCDLDSHILISEDPFKGLEVGVDGRVGLNEMPGLGVADRY
jgi:L-alanine-DL-glutamate epimerase-like enolase superfamily enzyme